MFTYDCIRFTHHKPPYKSFIKCDYGSVMPNAARVKYGCGNKTYGQGFIGDVPLIKKQDAASGDTGTPTTPEEMPPETGRTVSRTADMHAAKSREPSCHCGLLHFREWWEQTEVAISVCGKIIVGIPIFTENNTLRVINHNHSYFIPLEKVDYIRTNDGLNSSDDDPV